MRAWLGNARAEQRTVGLVPTMGAFHAGHHSLMRAAREEQDSVVVSLFVNPAQFNDTHDLAAYPRTEANDAAEAAELGVDVLFAPAVSEIYPDGFATTVQVTGLVGGLRGRRARPRALRRRLHGGQQAAEHRRAGRRLLRPEGRAAGRGHQADGARPRHAGADRGPADGARAGRARAVARATSGSRPRTAPARSASRARSTPPRRSSPPASATPTASARPRWPSSATSRPSTSRSSTPSPSPPCAPSAPARSWRSRRRSGPSA